MYITGHQDDADKVDLDRCALLNMYVDIELSGVCHTYTIVTSDIEMGWLRECGRLGHTVCWWGPS